MQILNDHQIRQKIRRLAIEVLEKNYEEPEIILAGINNNGMTFARLLQEELYRLTRQTLTLTQIRLHPADPLSAPVTLGLPIEQVRNKVIIVVDDVANTGRTIFYACKPLLDTLPKKIEVAVLVDRTHKSFPVKVDYFGLSLATTLLEDIDVQIREVDEFGIFELMSMFEHLKVVELAGVLAGPAVGMFFAEQGAEVIKVENKQTGGDTTRQWKLPEEDPASSHSAYFHSVNWHKKSLFVDLNTEADRQALHGLLREADILITNFKKGAAERLHLDYATLAAQYPQLIYASITAYGPDDERPGFDVAIQAETGWIFMNGAADGPPVKLPVALMDLLAAHQLKEGILVALLRRQINGKGCHVTVSLFDAGVSALANQASNWLNAGHLPQRLGSLHPNIAPYGEIFYSNDGQPLILATGTERHFQSLCSLLNLPEVAADSRFLTNAQRLTNRQALAMLLAEAFQNFSAATMLEKCWAAQVPVAPVRNLAELFQLPQAQRLVLSETLADGTESRRVQTAVFRILE